MQISCFMNPVNNDNPATPRFAGAVRDAPSGGCYRWRQSSMYASRSPKIDLAQVFTITIKGPQTSILTSMKSRLDEISFLRT